MREAKQAKRENLKEGLALLKSMSKYDIKNALTCKDLPLSDNDYICSDNFDKFARLKSHKSFIKANESAYDVTHLRP